LALGKTVKQLLEEISSAELSEWMAYEVLEPWGETRADYRAGVISSTYINCKLKKGAKKHKPADFMPRFGPPKKQNPEVIKELLMGLVSVTKHRK
jgi:hypothetical protein